MNTIFFFFFLAGGKKVCLPAVGIHISLSKANKEIQFYLCRTVTLKLYPASYYLKGFLKQ